MPAFAKMCFLLCLTSAAVTACKQGQAEQSFAQAMGEICAGPPVPVGWETLTPPERAAAFNELATAHGEWMEKSIRNPKARALLVRLAEVASYQLPSRIADAAKEAGIETCPYVHKLGLILPGTVTLVNSELLDLVDNLPIVGLREGAITLGSNIILSLKNWTVDAQELEGGALGIRIMRLTKYMAALKSSPPPRQPKVQTFQLSGDASLAINLLCEPETPYRLLFQVIASLRPADYRHFSLLVGSPAGSLGALTVQLPDSRPRLQENFVPTKNSEDEPLQLIVSMTKDRYFLWSISGLEGTLDKPRLVVERGGPKGKTGGYDLERLTDILNEIVKRRWPKAERPEISAEILIQADGSVPFRNLAALISATRHSKEGDSLFPFTILARPSFD